MEILFISSFVFLFLSFLADLLFNLIIMPIKKLMEKRSDGAHYVNNYDLAEYYRMNRPGILRKVYFLNFLVKSGGPLFFLLFSVLFLVAVYPLKSSIVWSLLFIPGLIFLYFIMNLVSTLLSRVIVR